ncbi:MetS family NSS transporter small subunit [Rubeoparvulum massiliense]|nr:MetS family NSS transporter small subunit [Rubeoparvulum massiliense]
MSGSAIAMMMLGFVGLWGGFAICVSIAVKRGKQSFKQGVDA